MNIYTVRDNLKTTISGKENYLKILANDTRGMNDGAAMAIEATKQMLEINIAELKRILGDIEVCCQHTTEASWLINSDRSGGGFTQEEIDRSGEWK